MTKCYNENKAEKAFHFSLREAPMDRAIRFLPCSGFRNILQALEAIRRVRDQYPRVLYCILQQQKDCFTELFYKAALAIHLLITLFQRRTHWLYERNILTLYTTPLATTWIWRLLRLKIFLILPSMPLLGIEYASFSLDWELPLSTVIFFPICLFV